MQPKHRRRLSSQPERITQVTVIYLADPLFFVIFFLSPFYTSLRDTKLLQTDPVAEQNKRRKKTSHYVNVNRAALPFPTINPVVREPNIFVINYRLLREVNKLLSTPRQYSGVACLNTDEGSSSIVDRRKYFN